MLVAVRTEATIAHARWDVFTASPESMDAARSTTSGRTAPLDPFSLDYGTPAAVICLSIRQTAAIKAATTTFYGQKWRF
jgi:hypothetical protein